MQEQVSVLVAIDVGSQRHEVRIGRSREILEGFSIAHTGPGFEQLVRRIERQRRAGETVWVIMEGSGGWIRPLDERIREAGYQLVSINNRKAARFREMFGEVAKSDELDVERAFLQLDWWLREAGAKKLCQVQEAFSEANRKLQLVSRHRRSLVEDKTRVMSRLHANLQAAAPGLMKITGGLDNQWFLRFLCARQQMGQLQRLRRRSVLQIPGVGIKRAALICQWQREAIFSKDVEELFEWIRSDVVKLVDLISQIDKLETRMRQLGRRSRLYTLLETIPGFGVVSCSELAGEIGTLRRFARESSLAVYLGVAPLEWSSGQRQGTRRAKLINRTAKNAICQAVSRHRQLVTESRCYYERKRKENGDRHSKAIRALARHLVRVIWAMARENRPYALKQAA